MYTFRLIAVAIVALFAFPLTGLAQQRAVLPGANTPVMYSSYIRALSGYEFAVPGKLLDHGAQFKCTDGTLNRVVSQKQYELKSTLCHWRVPRDVIVRLHVFSGMTDEQALRRAIEYALREWVARATGLLNIYHRKVEKVPLADGTLADMIRLDVKIGDGRNKFVPHVAAFLPQRGSRPRLMLLSHSIEYGCSQESGDAKCAAAVRAMLGNIQASNERLAVGR